jgi:hypothetical protein
MQMSASRAQRRNSVLVHGGQPRPSGFAGRAGFMGFAVATATRLEAALIPIPETGLTIPRERRRERTAR